MVKVDDVHSMWVSLMMTRSVWRCHCDWLGALRCWNTRGDRDARTQHFCPINMSNTMSARFNSLDKHVACWCDSASLVINELLALHYRGEIRNTHTVGSESRSKDYCIPLTINTHTHTHSGGPGTIETLFYVATYNGTGVCKTYTHTHVRIIPTVRSQSETPFLFYRFMQHQLIWISL